MTINDYLSLLTSAWIQKPKYTATVSLDVSVQTRVQQLLESMVPLFDVDIAVGNQLDIIGEWVGVTRNVSIPIEGVYFSWDTNEAEGWDYGTWAPSIEVTTVTTLPDDAYRILMKAKIAANGWDGTTDGAYLIWDSIFTEFTIIIQDNQNMTYALGVIGGIVDSLTLALLTGGYIPLRPEGVKASVFYVSVDSNPVFAWDVESTALAGWDEGSWVKEITPT